MKVGWRPKPGDRFIRRPKVTPEHIDVMPMRIPRSRPSSPMMLIYGFAGMIAVGTILLLLPISSSSGQFTHPIDALFTATSTVCVTGLVVVDTKSYWSPFGQAIILGLIQLGGLGFMTSSTLLLLLIGHRITLRERLLIRDALGLTSIGGLIRLIRRIVMVTVIVEGIGAVLLFLRFSSDSSPLTAVWRAVFHSVSAFNNAGFDIFGGFRSLADYKNDPTVVLLIAALFILGGISFTFLADIAKVRSIRRLTLDSRLVLVATLSLLAVGTLVILISEFHNQATLGPMTFLQKLMNAFFHAATPRTAGFSTLPISQFADYTLFFIMALMFIGGASGSTAGGIKINTFSVLFATILCSIRSKQHVEAFGREIADEQVYKALAIAMLAIALIFTVALLLSTSEGFPFINVFFETVSAFGTVGLTTGITPSLSNHGKLLLVVIMFAGRLGPLTLALSLTQRQRPARYRYAQEMVKIG